jgi:crotonobetainyl-CoA:carnitine CoA-transferase CaiB-like acyl-CoA transferase
MTVMTPFHIDGVEKMPPQRAPTVGQHNEHVLREAGYSGDDIERLRGLGVLA